MSRIGRKPIAIPQGVQIEINGNTVKVNGPKGNLTQIVHPEMKLTVDGNLVKVDRPSDEKEHRSLHGLTRTLVSNMVQGVTAGFSKALDINGVGYRAEVKGTDLHITLGYSHPILFPLPAGVSATVERQIIITLQSADRRLLGETAAVIRAFRPPEPYKGKGVKYREEVIKRKAGKAVGAAGSSQ